MRPVSEADGWGRWWQGKDMTSSRRVGDSGEGQAARDACDFFLSGGHPERPFSEAAGIKDYKRFPS